MENNITDIKIKRKTKNPFDAEYSTQWLKEVAFLKERDVYPTFIKTDEKTNISTYKYRKEPKLFAALVEYYTRVKVEKELRRESETMQHKVAPVDPRIPEGFVKVYKPDETAQPKDDTE